MSQNKFEDKSQNTLQCKLENLGCLRSTIKEQLIMIWKWRLWDKSDSSTKISCNEIKNNLFKNGRRAAVILMTL